jgi:ABC-type dipeptide/oligopeptide/nickel transport system permease subunit
MKAKNMSEGATSNLLNAEGLSTTRKYSLWRDALARLMANKIAVISLALVIFLVLIALIGPYITPYDFLSQNLSERNQTPSWEHWMGTDYLGRDVLSRVIYGARTATVTSFSVVAVSVFIGILLGSLSGYIGGRVDAFLMWITDMVMAVPPMLLAMVSSVALRPMVAAWMERMYKSTGNTFYRETFWADIFLLVTVLTLVLWPTYARLIRGQILTNKNKNYVLAARALGVPNRLILTKYIIPNSLGPVVVQLSAGLGSAILWESAFSFLGIGVHPPIPSWGNMISEGMDYWRNSPHLLAAPAIVLGLMTVAFSFLGDGLNDALNPRQWSD